MQLFGFISTLYLAFIASSEAFSHSGGLKGRQHLATGPSPTSGLGRRHADYTGHRLTKRAYNGRATWYNVGLGACGWYSNENENVVALAEVIWNQRSNGANINHNQWCGTKITISYNGMEKEATIVDLCPISGGCAPSDGAALDLSKSLFQSFAGLGAGVFQMSWHVSGESDGDSNDDAQQQDPDAAAAASSSSAAAAWAAAQSSSSAAAAAAASSSRAHEEWLSWNNRLSTSWEAVLEASEASVASQHSVQRAQAAASEAVESRQEARESSDSVRSERSASRASVQSEEGVSQSSEAAEGRDATNNRHSSDKGEIPDSAIQAVSDVTLRMANIITLFIGDKD